MDQAIVSNSPPPQASEAGVHRSGRLPLWWQGCRSLWSLDPLLGQARRSFPAGLPFLGKGVRRTSGGLPFFGKAAGVFRLAC
ncbi:MAG: hypothetical protein LBD89_06110, partial [Tannerellaceae bacterium]|nr:hypothetical protein [Tannerellaceae bacterium]